MAQNHQSPCIEKWYIIGGFPANRQDAKNCILLSNLDSLQNWKNPDSTSTLWYNGHYTPKYNLLDLKEVFSLSTPDDWKGLFNHDFYLRCDLYADKVEDMFLQVTTAMKSAHFFNGDSLHRTDIQGLNFYPIHIQKGNNRYIVRVTPINDETSIEVALMDSSSVVSQFVNGQSNNIVFPEISPDNKTVTLTNAHQNLIDAEVNLSFTDVDGRELHRMTLKRDTFAYPVPQLRENSVCLCTMEIAGKSVRQPIVCGSYDAMYDHFQRRRQLLGDGNPRSTEIDQLLFRLKFLLEHESRHHDWWWQFKLPPLFYQLEHTFAHLRQEIGEDPNAFNMQFVTYRSPLDGGLQRYLLATPDRVERGRKYPLAIIVRPQVQSHYPFFVSPQFAHQWATNIIQGLANEHQCIIMIPEARMYLDEDLTPMAEAEMQCAIDHVRQHYAIDGRKIYLHGICSGGYRALKMAALNPGQFAAVGVYAPSYMQTTRTDWEERRTLKSLVSNLKDTQIFLFADPNDRHTPPEKYAELIDDCRKCGVPLTVTQKINTELLYNAVVAGREAFDFFDGKCRSTLPDRTARADIGYNADPAVADLYARPFVYVYDHENRSAHYHNFIKCLKDDYGQYMDSPLPLVADDKLTQEMLADKNFFLIGGNFCNSEMQKLVTAARQDGTTHRDGLSVHRHPSDMKRLFVLYDITSKTNQIFRYPWIAGTQQSICPQERP